MDVIDISIEGIFLVSIREKEKEFFNILKYSNIHFYTESEKGRESS